MSDGPILTLPTQIFLDLYLDGTLDAQTCTEFFQESDDMNGV